METLTFYRRMANSNLDLIKKYKSNFIKKLNYDEIIDLYKKNNIDITLDILRLKKFNQDKDISRIEIPEKKDNSSIENPFISQNYNIIYISLIVIPIITLLLFYK